MIKLMKMHRSFDSLSKSFLSSLDPTEKFENEIDVKEKFPMEELKKIKDLAAQITKVEVALITKLKGQYFLEKGSKDYDNVFLIIEYFLKQRIKKVREMGKKVESV